MDKALTLSRRQALTFAAAACVAPRLASSAPSHPTLIELFTSQGCSSCPPADKIAAELATDPNIFVASFNVDYWDYLGWRDTLAKPEYSQRQYDYAKSRGDGSVYTPQMVINGATHAVGSNLRDVKSRLSEAAAPSVTMALRVTDKDIKIEIPKTSYDGEATLWLMAIEPEVKQKIERGENAGKDVIYVNVVRNLVPATMWKGEAYQGSWMRSAVMPHTCKCIIAVLQKDKVGPILGLARFG